MGNPETFVDSTTVSGAVAITSTGNVELISSQGSAIYVYAYSLSALSTAAGGTTMRMMSGSTTECWRVTLAGASSFIPGTEGLAVAPPSYLFRTAPGAALTYEKGNSSVSGTIASFSFGFWRQ